MRKQSRSSPSGSSSQGNLRVKKQNTSGLDPSSPGYHATLDLPNQIHIKPEASRKPTLKKENNENLNTINTTGQGNDGFIKRANDVMKAVQAVD